MTVASDELRKREQELLSVLPGPVAEYVHFREPDGSISTKRFAELTDADCARHLAQLDDEEMRLRKAIEDYKRGEISTQEVERINAEFELIFGDVSWERS